MSKPADHLSEAIAAFEEARRMTYDLLNVLPAEALQHKFSRPDLDTFGKHFQELGDTQACYTAGIVTGKIDFSAIRTQFDYDLVASAGRLREFLKSSDEELRRALDGASADQVVRWPEEERISIVEHLARLSRHETFHHGQFAIFVYELGLKFPESWIQAWAMPSRPGQLYRN